MKRYVITLKNTGGRDETISFPQGTTAQEIIDAATFYAKRPCIAEVRFDGQLVGMGRDGTFAAFQDSHLGQFMSTKQRGFA